MATKSSGKKAPAKKAATKAPAKKKATGLRVTSNDVTLTLTAEQKRQVKACIAKAGKVTIRFKEISVTKLPTTLSNGVLID